MKKVYKNRKKALGGWGALIGAGVSALTNIFGSLTQAKREEELAEKMYEQQEKLLHKQEIQNEFGQKLQNQIAEQENQSIYDELRQKNYKCGGKIKVRKKADYGTELMDIGSSIFTGLGNLGVSAINNNLKSTLSAYQLKLMDDKFNAENRKFNNFTNGQELS